MKNEIIEKVYINPFEHKEFDESKTIELSEKYPTGWLVVDTIDVSRFNENEVSQIVEFNQNKGRRCAIKRRPERARITAEEITNAVLLRLFADMHTVKED